MGAVNLYVFISHSNTSQEQLQECPTQHDVSQRLVHMEENNASMAAQINELLGQLVASEEQVLAGNARAEEYERRLVSATTARDRQIEELKHTIAELHAQNEEVLSFNSSTRAARDVALRDVTDAKAALEDLKDTHKEECLETSRKHSAATREIEAQLAVEVSVRQQKEAECFELATLLEEARSAADEVCPTHLRFTSYTTYQTTFSHPPFYFQPHNTTTGLFQTLCDLSAFRRSHHHPHCCANREGACRKRAARSPQRRKGT